MSSTISLTSSATFFLPQRQLSRHHAIHKRHGARSHVLHHPRHGSHRPARRPCESAHASLHAGCAPPTFRANFPLLRLRTHSKTIRRPRRPQGGRITWPSLSVLKTSAKSFSPSGSSSSSSAWSCGSSPARSRLRPRPRKPRPRKLIGRTAPLRPSSHAQLGQLL